VGIKKGEKGEDSNKMIANAHLNSLTKKTMLVKRREGPLLAFKKCIRAVRCRRLLLTNRKGTVLLLPLRYKYLPKLSLRN
jgi:hypothetical protein